MLQLPTVLLVRLSNSGQSTVFVVLFMFTDSECSKVATDFSIRPSEFVLSPGESRDVFLVAHGSDKQLGKAPGLIGMLHVVSSEEILRRRYKRMKNKGLKTHLINKPSLLELNWFGEFTGEDLAKAECDGLPPQPEDPAVFFNSCITTQVEVWGEPKCRDNESSTVFACLQAEQTVADITIPPSNSEVASSSVSQGAGPQPPIATASWDVRPQRITILTGDASPQIVFAVNYTGLEQMLEMQCSCVWVKVDPQEAVLPVQGTVRICVLAEPPHLITAPTTHTLKNACK